MASIKGLELLGRTGISIDVLSRFLAPPMTSVHTTQDMDDPWAGRGQPCPHASR